MAIRSKRPPERGANLKNCDAILKALARSLWPKSHGGAKCPRERIPSAQDMADWLPEFRAWDDLWERVKRILELPLETDGCAIAFTAYVASDLGVPVADLGGRPWIRQPVFAVETDADNKSIGNPRAGGFTVLPDGDGWQARRVATDVEVLHSQWLSARNREPDDSARVKLTHPIETLVSAWQARVIETLDDADTSAVNVYFVRRDRLVSRTMQAAWVGVDMPAIEVGGKPIAKANRRLDQRAIFGAAWGDDGKQPRIYKPGDQTALDLHGFATVQPDMRLVIASKLAEIDPILPGDVLALMAVAHATNRPLVLPERDGAMLLSRSLDGGFRDPEATDLKRFRRAIRYLDGLAIWDTAHEGRYVKLAIVDPRPDGSVILGPPDWMRGATKGQWLLTADGGRAGRARFVTGQSSTFGRLVSGLEHLLVATFDGHGKPYMQPARGTTGAGPLMRLPWRAVLAAGGGFPNADVAKHKKVRSELRKYERFVDQLQAKEYQIRGRMGLRGQAAAGDSVELWRVERGSIVIRASAPFVEAERLARLADGRGFATVKLTDWLGIDPNVR